MEKKKTQPASWHFVFMTLGKLCVFPRHDTILIALSGMRTISAMLSFNAAYDLWSHWINSLYGINVKDKSSSLYPPVHTSFMSTSLSGSCTLPRFFKLQASCWSESLYSSKWGKTILGILCGLKRPPWSLFSFRSSKHMDERHANNPPPPVI